MTTSGLPVTTMDIGKLEDSFEVLRSARSALVRMCKMIMEESGIQVFPSFMPDQCDGYGTPPTSDWTIRMGFGNCLSKSVGGTYGELCAKWLEGPEAFHDWLGHMAIASACEEVDGEDMTDGHVTSAMDSAEGGNRLPSPGLRALGEAKAGLAACGYLVSPAAIPSYMTVCSFVAWQDDTLVLVAVTDADDVEERKACLAEDCRRFLEQSGRSRQSTHALVIRMDDGRILKEDVEL